MELLEKIWEGTTTAVNGVLSGLDRGLTTLFGSANSRQLKRYGELAKQIGELEPRYMAMSDAELKEQTLKFRKRLADGQTLDDILVEAFACACGTTMSNCSGGWSSTAEILQK
jgi:preprotein translocase subunit SecA